MTLKSFPDVRNVFSLLPTDFREFDLLSGFAGRMVCCSDWLKSVRNRRWQTDGLSNHMQSIFSKCPPLSKQFPMEPQMLLCIRASGLSGCNPQISLPQWLSSSVIGAESFSRQVFTHLDLEWLLQFFDDCLSVLQLHAETFSIGDFSSESCRSHVHGWKILTGESRTKSRPAAEHKPCQGENSEVWITLFWGFSESYSPSCMAVAILFMVAMTMLQDCRRHS